MIPNRGYAHPPVGSIRSDIPGAKTDLIVRPNLGTSVGDPLPIPVGPRIRRGLVPLAALALVALSAFLVWAGHAGAIARVSEAAADEMPPVVADPVVAARLVGDDLRALAVTRYALAPGTGLTEDDLSDVSVVVVERGYAEAATAAGSATAGQSTAEGQVSVDAPVLAHGMPFGQETGGRGCSTSGTV